jgi:Holliday junction resolvase-like predicted endonuclease
MAANARTIKHTKQIGDAGEMLVAARLNLAGVSAALLTANWPDYDLIAQLPDKPAVRVTVKTRSVSESGKHRYRFSMGGWDWAAAVFLRALDKIPEVWIVPFNVLCPASAAEKKELILPLERLRNEFVVWKDNFSLKVCSIRGQDITA